MTLKNQKTQKIFYQNLILEQNPNQHLNQNPNQHLNQNPNQHLNQNPNQQLKQNPNQHLNQNPNQHLNQKTLVKHQNKNHQKKSSPDAAGQPDMGKSG